MVERRSDFRLISNTGNQFCSDECSPVVHSSDAFRRTDGELQGLKECSGCGGE